MDKQIINHGLITFTKKVLLLIFNFSSFMLLVRLLSKENFGIWVLFFLIVGSIQMIRNGFIMNPFLRYMKISKSEELSSIRLTSLFLNFSLSVAIGLLIILFRKSIALLLGAPQLTSFISLACPIIILSAIRESLSYHLTIQSEFLKMSIAEVLEKAFFFFLLLYLYWTNQEVEIERLVGLQILFILFAILLLSVFAYRSFHLSTSNWKTWIAKLSSYGKFTFGTNISSVLMRNIDSWMLGGMVSPAAVATYNPAIRISNIFQVPADSLTTVLFPRAVSEIHDKGLDAAKRLYEKSSSFILATVIPLVIIILLFTEEIILLIAGNEYLDSVDILQITMFYTIIIPFNRQLGMILTAMGLAKLNLLFLIRNALLNTLLNYLFINTYGIQGAAYATLISYISIFVMNQLYLERKFNVELKNYFKYFLEFYKLIFNQIWMKVKKR